MLGFKEGLYVFCKFLFVFGFFGGGFFFIWARWEEVFWFVYTILRIAVKTSEKMKKQIRI